MELLGIISHTFFRTNGCHKTRSPSPPYGPASQGSQLITLVGPTRVTVESWTLKVVVLLLLLRHLVVVDLGDLTVRTGQA